MPLNGNARILHITDVHGQLLPVYFREPNVNLGVGDAFGRPPHVVGKGLLKHIEALEHTNKAFRKRTRVQKMVNTLFDSIIQNSN